SRMRRGDQPRGERRRRGAAGGGRHRRIHPAAGRDRPGPLNRIAALGLFACAIRGGPVELVEPDAADAQVHWSDAALAIVLADARAAARLPFALEGAGPGGAEAGACDHRLARALVLRSLAWARAGTGRAQVEDVLSG